MTQDKLLELVETAELFQFAEPLLQLVRDSARIISETTAASELETGQSRIGGSPDLPQNLPWPEWEGMPLSFMAQIRLSDLARVQQMEIAPPATNSRQLPLFEFEPQPIAPKELTPIIQNILPQNGILYFFSIDAVHGARHDWITNPNAWRVIYHESEEAGQLVQTPSPVEAEQSERIKSGGLSFWQELTLPAHDSHEIQSLGLTPRQQEDYQEMLFDLEKAQGLSDFPAHRLLGYPHQIQNNMQEECQLLSAGQYRTAKSGHIIIVDIDIAPSVNRLAVPDWKLLLQVENGWGGLLYYWIPDAALARREFSKAWAVLQYD